LKAVTPLTSNSGGKVICSWQARMEKKYYRKIIYFKGKYLKKYRNMYKFAVNTLSVIGYKQLAKTIRV